MQDPPRLIHSNPEFARFVAASNNEEPATEQLEQALSLAAKTAAPTRWSTFRWLAPGLAVSIALIGASVVLSTSHSPERIAIKSPVTVAPVVAPLEAPMTTVSVNDLASSSPADGVPAAPVESARTPRALPVRAKSHVAPARVAPSSSADRSTFSEELALVSAARSALEAADVRTCLREVDRYEERFRSGVFAHEMEVIRIEALVGSGERARAELLAKRFLSSNPNSPYADLVRSLTDRTPE